MAIKVFDSELKVMEALWKEGDLTAGQLVKILKEQTGWNPNTTYTVIGKLIDKGAIERYGTNFSCKALITKEQVRRHEAAELINKLYDGSKEIFLSAFLQGAELSADEIERLKKIVKELS
jgi:predicted transcriptional regulator